MRDPLFLVVLAGGSGLRLADFVRRREGNGLPKQFCSFGHECSLLQQTVERTRPLIADENVVVVVDRSHADRAMTELQRFPGARIVAQPCNRGTAPGVLLPVSHILWRHPDAVVLVAPSDHGIRDGRVFRRAIWSAVRAVRGGVADPVVFGAEASSPRSDYGWIVPGEGLGRGLSNVAAFVEKPPAERARELLAAGALWNTMLLVARAGTLQRLYRRLLPRLAATLEAAGGLRGSDRAAFLRRRYARITPSDFSRDVLQRAPGLSVKRLPAEVGWTDVGTPERMTAWLEGAGHGVTPPVVP